MAKNRTVFYVTTDGAGGWNVKREGNSKVLGNYRNKDQAIEYARQLAYDSIPSQVKVQKMDGTFQVEWTYGDDPSRYES